MAEKEGSVLVRTGGASNKAGEVLTSELIGSPREELPVEMDFVLPDDSPDVVKLLHCALSLEAVTAEPAGDGVLLEGSVAGEAWYIADTGLLHRACGHMRFSKKSGQPGMTNEGRVSGGCVRLLVCGGYCNARPVNQRRLEVKGALELIPETYAGNRQSFLQSRESLETRNETRTLQLPLAHACARFLVDEERSLPEELPAIGSVLRCQGIARLTDRKAVEGKLVTRGELDLDLTYQPEGGDGPVHARFALPVSHLLDLPAGLQDDRCVRYTLDWITAEPRSNGEGQRREVSVRAGISVFAVVHGETTVTAVTDAYDLEHETVLRSSPLVLPCFVRPLETVIPCERRYDLPASGATALQDVWAAVYPLPIRHTPEGIAIPLRLRMMAFLSDANGRPAFWERSEELMPVVIPGDDPEQTLGCVTAEVTEAGCTLSEDAMTFTAAVNVTGCVYDRQRWEVLTSAEPGEPLTPPPAPLTLYYAGEGEQVWDIAKHFHAPVAALRDDTGAEPDSSGEASGLLLIERE